LQVRTKTNSEAKECGFGGGMDKEFLKFPPFLKYPELS